MRLGGWTDELQACSCTYSPWVVTPWCIVRVRKNRPIRRLKIWMNSARSAKKRQLLRRHRFERQLPMNWGRDIIDPLQSCDRPKTAHVDSTLSSIHDGYEAGSCVFNEARRLEADEDVWIGRGDWGVAHRSEKALPPGVLYGLKRSRPLESVCGECRTDAPGEVKNICARGSVEAVWH